MDAFFGPVPLSHEELLMVLAGGAHGRRGASDAGLKNRALAQITGFPPVIATVAPDT